MSDTFAQADQANRLNNAVRFGVIDGVRIEGGRSFVSVELEDDLVTDFLPVFQAFAGRVRSHVAPVRGEQVAVLAPSGELTAGAVLRGLNCDAFVQPATADDLIVLAMAEDGFSDTYDEAAHERVIAVPAGGKLTLSVGALTVRIEAGKIVLDAAGSPIEMSASAFTLDGPVTVNGAVNLGGTGGKGVARIGDAVTGGVITGGSTTVKAA